MTARRRPWRLAWIGAALLVGGAGAVVAVSGGPPRPVHVWAAFSEEGGVRAARDGPRIDGWTLADAERGFVVTHPCCGRIHVRLDREPSRFETLLASLGLPPRREAIRLAPAGYGEDLDWTEYVECPEAMPGDARTPADVEGDWMETRTDDGEEPPRRWRLAAGGAAELPPAGEGRDWRWGVVADVLYLEGRASGGGVEVRSRILGADRTQWRAPDGSTGSRVSPPR